MRIVRFGQAQRCEPEAGWRRASLCNQEPISVEYFEKPAGHASPVHQHPNAQLLIVLEGRLVITTMEGEEHVLDEHDAAFIPADEPHAVTNPLEKPSAGLDIFVPGRSFDFWLKRKQSQPPPLPKKGNRR